MSGLAPSTYSSLVARSVAAIVLIFLTTMACADGLVDTVVRRFAQSDFEFVRVQSNAPFLPVAWVTTTAYDEFELSRPDGTNSSVTSQQLSISEGAFVPITFGPRDALILGQWVSWTRFDLKNSPRDDLEVLSVAIPIGWIRQESQDWQAAAFVAPLGHTTDDDGWYWETLGGAFARHLSSDRFAWIVGVYFDVAPLEDFYTPYLGAAYVVNERWTLNAVMPWPSVSYAPTINTFFSLGVTPSGTSWSIEPGERKPRVNLSAWNIGVAVEHRLFSNVWLRAEVGVSGLRGLSFAGSDWQDVELDSTGFALLTFNLRPHPKLYTR